MTEKKIKEIISDLKEKGYSITVRDVAYKLLSDCMPKELAYKSIFMDERYSDYLSSSNMVALESYWKFNVSKSSKTDMFDTSSNNDSKITYDDNRKAMENLIKDLTQAIKEDRFAEDRDRLMAQKTVADLRIKLSDKFGVQDNEREQVVIVEPKFNAICKCGREIHIPTKEELMKRYNLTESNK